MATSIEQHCVNSGDCVDLCPNAAIIPPGQTSPAGNVNDRAVHWIDPDLCTECVGFYGYEMCASVCPVKACLPDGDRRETELVLIRRGATNHDPESGTLKDSNLPPPCQEDELSAETSHFRNQAYVAPDDPAFVAPNAR